MTRTASKAARKGAAKGSRSRAASPRAVEGKDTVAAVLAATDLPPHGAVIDVPLSRLIKSPRNVRRTPHSAEHIEALAGSIAAKGMLQKPVVEPEYGEDGAFTGNWLATIGEGRRQAMWLRVERGEIGPDEPVSCVVDLTNDPQEISLDENVTREDLHPADQFEAFQDQSVRLGRSAEEIAARFGTTPLAVRRLLKLARVSPKLIEAYRAGDLTLDDLMAFAVSEDHERQEQVYEQLPPYRVDPSVIRRSMTERKVPAGDRRAIFVGVEAYEAAHGRVLRDLFAEDRGGWFEDVPLLERLCLIKLQREAERLREAEGWKWADFFIDHPHHLALHRVYPERIARSEADETKIAALHDELEALTNQWADEEEAPAEVEARIAEIEEALNAFPEPYAYKPEDVARGGLFVVLDYDGEARIERGFIRAEDLAPEPEDEDRSDVRGDGEGGDDDRDVDDEDRPPPEADEEDGSEPDRPLSAALVAELTAYRTLGLRDALAENPDAALVVTVHALALQVFFHNPQLTCADLRLSSTHLRSYAPEIEACPAGRRIAERGEAWEANLPRNPVELWDYVVGLDHDSRMALLAHCVSLSLNGVRSWERRMGAWAHADVLATHLRLDMTTTWAATAESYFGRVTKAKIAEAVTQTLDAAAASRIEPLKKPDMAKAAEALVAGKGWLPALLRTPDAAMDPMGGDGAATDEAPSARNDSEEARAAA